MITWAICLLLVFLFVQSRYLDFSNVFAQDNPTETLDDVDATPSPASGNGNSSNQRSVLQTLFKSGVVGGLIVLLSVVAVGFIVEHALTIRKSVMMPEDVADMLEQQVHAGEIEAALATAQDPANECLFTNVCLAGLERYTMSEFGFAEYKAAVEEAGEEETGRLYRKTEVLNLIGSISPMLGLTGTVLGMIISFNQIAGADGKPQPSELADGIGLALVTTLLGLIVAIPTMIAFSYFRNKIDSIVAEAGKRVERVLMPLSRRR
ncbi:MAG TPA: MotA/TolQ/ExbB proton channel family protein [Planctomycetaceae bacterium]|nr:peptide transporter TolQ [Blastopirellula sp.]HAY79623.1 MotA/TolQ/ExbB proton channel family protein [Planctomycetaceae bacterium]